MMRDAIATWPGMSVERAGAQSASRPHTVMVAMRDGTRLATDVSLPAGDGPWPVALVRTPYGRSTNVAFFVPPSCFTPNGIALVAQDTRGRFASEGHARPLADDAWGERQDGADTVAWLRQQPWCNGKIATFGSSYPGMMQFLLAGAGPEGIVGQLASVSAISGYDAFFQNRVLRGWVPRWVSTVGWPGETLPTFRQHAPDDDYWRGQDLRTRPQQVRWPIVHLGGWFDIFLQGTIDAFTTLQERGGEGARGRQRLLIGPWTHRVAEGSFPRQAGELRFPANAGLPPIAADPFRCLSCWLKGQPPIPADEPAVHYYVMGDVTDPQAPGNTWRAADQWPPPSRPLPLYFSAEGGLTPQLPAEATNRTYDYDPARPVPTLGGQELLASAGPRDQRPVEGRPDVLVFSTPALTEPLEVTGRIRVRLHAASSARDTDFTAKLTDVYPDGRSMLVTDGIVRARYHRSLSEPAPIKPGEGYPYEIDLGSTSIIFNRGHRIRVTISSSNAPRFEPNPNTWPEEDAIPQVARQTITLGGPEASYILLPEVRG